MKIRLNPDKEYVKNFIAKLKENGMYCPCQLQKNEDTKCQCKLFREQTEPGFCVCGLYEKYMEDTDNGPSLDK